MIEYDFNVLEMIIDYFWNMVEKGLINEERWREKKKEVEKIILELVKKNY